MKRFFFPVFFVILLSSCQHLYTYRFPNESEQKRFADSLKWSYSGSMITSIPVADEQGRIYRLPITAKTKIEVKTIYGEMYRFYIQSITITGDDGFLGTNQMWRGYELLNHTERTIMVREVA